MSKTRHPNPSGLSREHRIRARDRCCHANLLIYRHRDQVHYTQGGRRWDGIRGHHNARLGQFPTYGDCSAIATWGLWNGLYLSFGHRDNVNGLGWHAGFTGTLLQHGVGVSVHHMQRGDLVIYGRSYPGVHVATFVGYHNGIPMVVSHGSERGPLYVPLHYRNDVLSCRRYI